MKVLYAIDTDRIPGVVDYYYELPTFPTCPADRGMPKPEMLNEEFELKEAPEGLWNNDWCRRLIPTGDGDVLGEGFEDTDWYYEHIAGAPRKEVAEFDRKVWAAMKAAGIRR